MSLFDTFTVRAPRPGAKGNGKRNGLARINWLWPAGLLVPVAMTLVLAGIAHIVSILAMPALAEHNAFARLSELTDSNVMKLLADPTPNSAVLPMQDPAFISAVCLYDLNDKPLKVRVPATADYTSVSFYTDEGLPFYALSDQAAGKVIELDLMNADQKAALPEDEEITAADRLVIEAPSEEGIVLVRALARDRSMRELVRRQLEAASCAPAN